MSGRPEAAGYFRSGMPYNRLGDGPRTLVVFQGLLFQNEPLAGLMKRAMVDSYGFLAKDHTVHVMTRRRGLPAGTTMADLANDYAVAVEQELGGPVDVLGVSTGASIALHFAADHPGLVRRLVIHAGAHTLSDSAKTLQLRVGRLALEHRWWAAYVALLKPMMPRRGALRYVSRPALWAAAALAARRWVPEDPSDLWATIVAEDKHRFKDRLGEIAAPTLVVAGDEDPFYTPELFRETAAGIPNARLILYPGKGHAPSGKRFRRDVLAFLE